MRSTTEREPAGDNFSPETLNTLNTLLGIPAHASTTTQSGSHGLASILYAEDDSVLRGLSVDILAHSGYAVTPVEDGREAWDALHSYRYDLLITDNNMPRMSGLELAAKTRLEGMKLPIIVASGTAGLLAETNYDWLSVAARLQKPFATDELLKTVEQVLRPAASVRQRSDIFFAALPQRFSHITPYQHWGLNE
jgi:DNA-binding response OmpR family regulator